MPSFGSQSFSEHSFHSQNQPVRSSPFQIKTSALSSEGSGKTDTHWRRGAALPLTRRNDKYTANQVRFVKHPDASIPDMVESDGRYNFVYLQNYGDGTFRAAASTYILPNSLDQTRYAYSVATGDPNDGKLDIGGIDDGKDLLKMFPVDAGQNLGVEYATDINGVNPNSYRTAGEIEQHTHMAPKPGGGGGGLIFRGMKPCVPPNYCAYSGQDIIQWPNPVPNVGTYARKGTPVYDTSYVAYGEQSENLAPVVRCTDVNTEPGGPKYKISHSAGQGGTGNGILFNTNSTLLFFGNGGAGEISLFNPLTMACGDANGYVITKDHDLTNPGSASAVSIFGTGGQFSLTDPTVWYNTESVQDGALSSQVVKYTINPSNGDYTVGPVMADFQYAVPLAGNGGVSEWQASHSYSYGNYIYHTLSAAEYYDWTASWSSFILGDLMVPSVNNPGNCAFKLIATGTTGSTEPMWNTSACTSFAPITDGTAQWHPLGGKAVFVFQLTAPATGTCTSGASTPVFVPTKAHPDQFTEVTDNSCTWTNVNPNSAIGWEASRSVDRTATKFVMAMSSTFYGYVGEYAADVGDQNTGIWFAEYDATSNIYHLVNSATGILSDVICAGGTGYNCAEGTRSFVTLGQVAAFNNCNFTAHSTTATQDGMYVNLAYDQASSGCPNSAFVWLPTQTPFNADTQIQLTVEGFNHPVAMDHSIIDINDGGYGATSGVWNVIYPGENLTADPLISWQVKPCSTAETEGVYDPPSCAHSIVDDHMSAAYNPGGTDTYPVCGAMYNYATLSPIAFDAWQGEILCQTTSPTWTNLASPSTQQKQWRFTHTFGTGTISNFDAQFQISEVSQDGRFVAFSSDWNSQLGSTTGSAPTLPVANSSVTCLGGLPWRPSYAYAQGTLIHPIQGTSGGGTIYHVFQAISGGTSGSSAPVWAGSSLGNQITDGGATWQDLGPGNCRGEVFVVRLK